MIIKITQLNGISSTIEILNNNELILCINSLLSYSFDCVELFYNDCCITTSRATFENVKLVNDMEILMIIHDKPLRLLDSNILRYNNQVKWDIIRMEDKYGPVEDWDTSWVTDMSHAFEYNFIFNKNISKWDVSNVKNMTGMFYNAYSFSQDISKWNVSNVENMNDMFSNAFDFNVQHIFDWDISSVIDITPYNWWFRDEEAKQSCLKKLNRSQKNTS